MVHTLKEVMLGMMQDYYEGGQVRELVEDIN
jgi:hypothetical protein